MSEVKERQFAVSKRPIGPWIQTEREAHENWAKMSVLNPRASSLLHVLLAHMGRHNALIASHKNLARLANCSVSTLRRSLLALKEGNWIEVRHLGESGTTNAYIVNDRVAWSGDRGTIRFSYFSAQVVVSSDDQPDKHEMDDSPPLRRSDAAGDDVAT